jgi:hypothetical protein
MSAYTEYYTGSKKTAKILKDPTKHYPNGDEAKALRHIMSSTGLSEEEVRQDKTHRKTLAAAQKQGQKRKRSNVEKFYQDLIKRACKKTGLVPQHPDTIKALDEIIKDRSNNWFYSSRYFLRGTPKAETVVKQYAK